jgi:hypothetical protein
MSRPFVGIGGTPLPYLYKPNLKIALKNMVGVYPRNPRNPRKYQRKNPRSKRFMEDYFKGLCQSLYYYVMSRQ